MSQATTCPQIVHDVQNYKIIQEKSFSVKIFELFSPRDGTLKFYLKKPVIPWLHMDENQGILYGIAPKVPYTKLFKFTLTACNEMGFVTKSFILIVIDTDVVETMPQTLEFILSMRTQDYGYSHLHPYTPSLLEMLYHFYQFPQYQEGFRKSVHKTAKERGVKISEKVTFHEFESLIKSINPDIEKILQDVLDQDHALTEMALNNEDLQNLLREGAQFPGSITFPIWNHCGIASFSNWPEWRSISNVLHSAADSLRKLREENDRHQLRPELKPTH